MICPAARKTCQHEFPWLPWRGALISFIVWCAVGAAVGWLAGLFMRSSSKTVRIEEILVGIFGAFIGGEFLADVLHFPKTPGSVSIAAVGMAVVAAVVLLVLLRVMRGAVGPQQQSKSRANRR
jgi:uncharacterized membrane protein YeaQ/YmgE (transglycosylase-associated protein family)